MTSNKFTLKNKKEGPASAVPSGGVYSMDKKPNYNSRHFEILTNKIGETNPYLECPKHAHHTVTVQSRLHLYFYTSISAILMFISRVPDFRIARSAFSDLRQYKTTKPLSQFTRNLTEPHDRGITYHLSSTISIMLMSIQIAARIYVSTVCQSSYKYRRNSFGGGWL